MHKELLHRKVIREIISLIVSGQFPQGKRLPAERKLCELFVISRGTLRLALADLEKLGVVSIKRGSGIYVSNLSKIKMPAALLPPNLANTSLLDIIYARKTIEVAAIELTCEKITDKQIESLEKLLAKMIETRDNLPEFVKFDMDFHRAIVKASGNTPLSTALKAIAEYHKYSQIFSSLHEGEESLAISYHKKILSAIKARNKQAAKKALSAHLTHLEKNAEIGSKNL
ncbi:MAG: FadR family transcriptional regulator [Anaerohalosphaeraceae bacterium]|nr:FadR family transcriptional regulator [Anaerohalosphaeraceae bacterium]